MNNIEDMPIGVFDSGVGGLTVAREIMKQLPYEDIVYFGDTARVPYGNKSAETVIRYSSQIVNFLITKNVKAIVIACNTASSYAIEAVSSQTDIPIIGVIHAGALAAIKATHNSKIGVIGTTGTISSDIYKKTIKSMSPDMDVIQKACPLFVPLVEEGFADDTITDEIAERYLRELKDSDIDTLVLGCTHYPLIYDTISRTMGDKVILVNPAYETASELVDLLKDRYLMRKSNDKNVGSYSFYTSDMTNEFIKFAESIVPSKAHITEKINIEDY